MTSIKLPTGSYIWFEEADGELGRDYGEGWYFSDEVGWFHGPFESQDAVIQASNSYVEALG